MKFGGLGDRPARPHNCPMRKFVSAALATALVAMGGGGMIYLLLFASGWKGWMVMGAGFVFVAGAVWLYDDFKSHAPSVRK